MKRGIHQLLPVFTWGDAIGGIASRTQALLREAGFASDIFADVIDRRLLGAARPASELGERMKAADGLLYHLSIGHPATARYLASRARKILVYHNMTPAHYYDDTSPAVAYWLRRGRDELGAAASGSDLCIGDSTFNADEIVALGTPCQVIPPLLDIERLRPRPGRPAHPPRLLCVGRLAPNKRQDVAVRALAAIPDGPESPVVMLVGGTNDTGPFAHAVAVLAQRLEVERRVSVPSLKMSDAELGDAYSEATMLLLPSEHEGFCVPAVEAMRFGVPVIAHAAAALPETVGDAGILLDSLDPLAWAAAIERVISDRYLATSLASAGRLRAAAFAPAHVAPQWLAALAGIGLCA